MIKVAENKMTMQGLPLPAIVIRNNFNFKFGEITSDGELKCWFNYQAFKLSDFANLGLGAPRLIVDSVEQGIIVNVDYKKSIGCDNLEDVIRYLNGFFVEYLLAKVTGLTRNDIELL